MNAHRWLAGWVAATVAACPMSIAAQCRAQSAEHEVAVFELYTSEGCDSCPPADRWFSALKGAQPSSAVALAFHVDYWDRLGWRDRFGSAAYTARQHDQATRQHAAFVYTPQVLLQGEDFAWRSAGQPAAAISAINARPARAKIELAAGPVERDAATLDVRVRIGEPRDRAGATLAVALVQDGLASEVKAGENAGRRLEHDHVVRQWHVDAVRLDGTGQASERLVLALPRDPGPLSVVAFVESDVDGSVLQAVSLPLCGR
jgi:hypothetical protein